MSKSDKARLGQTGAFCNFPGSFLYFETSPEITRLAVMLFIRFPLPMRNVELAAFARP